MLPENNSKFESSRSIVQHLLQCFSGHSYSLLIQKQRIQGEIMELGPKRVQAFGARTSALEMRTAEEIRSSS